MTAGKLCLSYTGECVALLHALSWFKEHRQDALICTDSLSLHSALEQNNHKDRDPWLKKIKKALFNMSNMVTFLCPHRIVTSQATTKLMSSPSKDPNRLVLVLVS